MWALGGWATREPPGPESAPGRRGRHRAPQMPVCEEGLRRGDSGGGGASLTGTWPGCELREWEEDKPGGAEDTPNAGKHHLRDPAGKSSTATFCGGGGLSL